MSFSHDTKNELARVDGDRTCCQLAELAAIFRMDGGVRMDARSGPSLFVASDNAAAARKVFRLFKNMFQVQAEIVIRRQNRLKKHSRYVVRIPPQAKGAEILRELEGSMPRRLCCRRAYLRGSFLAGGSVNNPEGTYHLEISTRDETIARDICRVMNRCGLAAKISPRKNWFVVYLKESEQIVAFLNMIGAHSALLNFENVRIVKGMRNQVNRLVNCETANLGKVVNAALRQIEKIRLIEDTVGLGKLPPPLREMAELRLQYPETCLKELGYMMTPRVGKSGVNHRMRKLEEIASRIEAGRPAGV
jgi:DNA-binding protein WhiA